MESKYIKLIFLFFISMLHSQGYYSDLRDKYWEYDENDVQAMPYVNLYIKSAKKEKNYAELFQAYSDAIRFTPNKKLQYADSTIVAAKLAKNPSLLGSAYLGKGSVYYFTYRKFQPALDQYLKASQSLEKSDDFYLKQRNLYYIGVVKSYLGFYEEAAEIFKKCIDYFEPNTKGDKTPNLLFNNRKGYLNSLHQLIVCEQEMKHFQDAQMLIVKGFKNIPDQKEFAQEQAYFFKSQGVNDFYAKQYASAISNLEKSIVPLKNVDDFSWISEVDYYLGLCYKNLGDNSKAVSYYQTVDSIFNKRNFILPETRKNYEELIEYYKNRNDASKELYYTKQLLKVDRILGDDFKYLSKKIHKEYDTKSLLSAQADLEDSNFKSRTVLWILLASIGGLLGLVFYWSNRKKALQKKYEHILADFEREKAKQNVQQEILFENIVEKEPEILLETEPKEEKVSDKISKLDPATIMHLKKKFSDFEKNKRFLERGITAGRLAAEFETNATYFSQFVSDFKASNFNTYLNKLRIDHAVDQITNYNEWRKYSVEDIALASGFSNRQSFSNSFFEQKGIRPADFLKKRNEEVDQQDKEV